MPINNPKGLRGRSITPKILQLIERDLEQPNANKQEIANNHGVSVWSVRNIDRARRKQPIIVKGIIK